MLYWAHKINYFQLNFLKGGSAVRKIAWSRIWNTKT